MSAEYRPIRVALFCDVYLPGFRAGGPPVSISRIIEQETQADIRVITRDRDSDQTYPYPHVAIRSWTSFGKAQVAYLRPGARDWPWVIRQLREWRPDVVYLNSLQSPWFSLLPHFLHRLRALPAKHVLLAPRGETSPGARHLKGSKKALARPLIKRLLSHPLIWHASSDLEKVEISNWWGGDLPKHHSCLIAANPAPTPAAEPSVPQVRVNPRIVFASRIERKKGLLELISALTQVEMCLDVDIHGVIRDPQYWRACQAAARGLPPSIDFRYHGEYKQVEIANIMSEADLFAFPTYGENFGHVIAEALSVGCPVLTTPTTPWTSLLERGGGWIVRKQDEIAAAVCEIGGMSRNERLTMRREVYKDYLRWFRRNDRSQQVFRFDYTFVTSHSQTSAEWS